MVAQVGPLWTVEEYLRLERYSTVKHEYHDGYVYAMAGGSQAHSQIAGTSSRDTRTSPPSASTCWWSTGDARSGCGGATIRGPGPPRPTGRPTMSCWTAWP